MRLYQNLFLKYSISLGCTILLFVGLPKASYAQEQEELDTALTSSIEAVQIIADPRLAVLSNYRELSKVINYNNSGSIRTNKGYRILIYSGTDRSKANATKIDFMRKHPGTRVYMSYALPQYRVKVGDYATRTEAIEFYRELSTHYSPCMIVPDIVEINTFRKND